MCRFVLLDAYKDKGKWFVVIYDKAKHFLYVESLRRFRCKGAFYAQHGVQKGGDNV